MENYSTPKKMKQVGDLFEKYLSRFKPPQATIEKECVEAIFKVTGYKIAKEHIVYTVASKTVNLRIPSILKTEIKFKHKEILDELRKKVGDKDSPTLII